MNEGYTNTVLLDCSRLNSEEGKTRNTSQYAQFTNKLGAGIKLNAGDVVEVHSGFVSELGCGQSTIEFQEKDLKTPYEVEEVYQEKTQLYWNLRISGSTEAIAPYGDLPPFNAHCVQYKTRKNKYVLKDNEAHLSVSYFKSANGEGYFHLPRRYDATKREWYINSKDITTPGWAEALMGQGKGLGHQFDSYVNGLPYACNDMPVYRNYHDLQDYRFGGVPAVYENNPTRTATMTQGWKYKNDCSRYTIFVKEITYYGERYQFGKAFPDVDKIKSVAKGDDVDTDNNTMSRTDTDLNIDTHHIREPCMSEYVWYKEDKKVTAKEGFNSPSSVAADITDQLNVRGPLETLHGTAGGTFGAPTDAPPFSAASTVGMVQTQVSTSADSTLFKRFSCANPYTFNQQGWEAYWGQAGVQREIPNDLDTVAGTMSPYGLNWLNSHATIGVKRPELFITGRDLYKNADLITKGDDGVDEPDPIGITGEGVGWRDRYQPQMTNMVEYPNGWTGEIWTSFKWNQKNLDLLKAWFDAQGKDPTLFGESPSSEHISSNEAGNQAPIEFREEGSSPNNSRFIHMNPYQTDDNETPLDTLGSDNYEKLPIQQPTVTFNESQQSAPLWIFYDKDRGEENTGGLDENDYYLRYGFARKRTVTKVGTADAGTYDVIAFTTRLVGGISPWFFNKSGYPRYPHTPPAPNEDGYYLNGKHDGAGGGAIAYNQLLGADPHFNAYGTDCICLYNGLLDKEVKKTTDPSSTFYAESPSGTLDPKGDGYLQSFYSRLVYVGADNPQLNFDTVGARFNWQQLHTPEFSGNGIWAGQPDVPINPNASQSVWKLNKRPYRTIFCPDLRPYPEDIPVTFTTPGNPTQTYLPFNENLTPWTFFDSNCGIFIEDFNVSEKDWASSMWGILGFTYDQFNTKNPTYNRQFNTNDIQITTADMGAVTTNANVDSSDLVSFNSNTWGAQYYNTTPPMVMGKSTGAAFVGSYSYLPPSTKDATSSEITAEQLPAKMLNAYYVIKSDLIGDYNYFGGYDGGQSLPAMYIVNKENGFGDFFFEGTGQATFTITKPRTITSITTSIHNPDFTLASVSPNSAIIYKITKTNTTPLDIASQVLNDTKKSKGKL